MPQYHLTEKHFGKSMFTAESEQILDKNESAIFLLKEAASKNRVLTNVDLSGIVLNGVHLTGLRLNKASLVGVTAVGMKLSNCEIRGCVVNGASLRGSVIEDTNFGGSTFVGSRFMGSSIARSSFERCLINKTDLSGSVFDRCDFDMSYFNNVDLTNTKFSATNFPLASFKTVSFESTILYNSDISRIELMTDVTGNKNEIKSFQIERYSVVYSKTWLQVETVLKPIDFWLNGPVDKIISNFGDPHFEAWWEKWGPFISLTLSLSPAK